MTLLIFPRQPLFLSNERGDHNLCLSKVLSSELFENWLNTNLENSAMSIFEEQEQKQTQNQSAENSPIRKLWQEQTKYNLLTYFQEEKATNAIAKEWCIIHWDAANTTKSWRFHAAFQFLNTCDTGFASLYKDNNWKEMHDWCEKDAEAFLQEVLKRGYVEKKKKALFT